VSAAAILDGLFAFGLLQTGRAINPVAFAGAIGSYLVLAVIALFTVVPRRERAYVGPILPIYFLYVLAHIVPITVGFGNWVALRLWGRRIYRDHYQLREDDPTAPCRPTLRPTAPAQPHFGARAGCAVAPAAGVVALHAIARLEVQASASSRDGGLMSGSAASAIRYPGRATSPSRRTDSTSSRTSST